MPNSVVIWNKQGMDCLDLQTMMHFLYVAVIQKIKKKKPERFTLILHGEERE